MKQHCKECAQEFEAKGANVKRGWGLYCSKSCAAKHKFNSFAHAKKAATALKKFEAFKLKFFGQVQFPEVAPKSTTEKFTVVCSRHGEIETTLNTRSRKHGCWMCASNKQVIKEGQKECTICKQWKLLSEYKKERGRPMSRCKQCENIRQREGAKKWDKEKMKAAVQKYAAKKRLEKSYSSNVIICKCEQCSLITTYKGTQVRRFCSKACSAEYRRLKSIGRKKPNKDKECKCKRCNTLYISKQPGYCNSCRLLIVAIRKKAEKKKRRALLRTRTAHTIVDTKVFARDKWRCKMCCCVVQKQDIYKDNAAEVDHIVPLSLGGPHTYSNVQTLCRKCNQAKSNKYNGQLVLAL